MLTRERKPCLISALPFVAMLGITSPSAAESEFDRWVKQEQAELDAFLSQHDQAFVDYLEQEWRAFSIYAHAVEDPTPKPVHAPQRRAQRLNRETTNTLDDQATPVRLRGREIHSTPPAHSFYGHELPDVTLPFTWLKGLDTPSQEVIADTWRTLAQHDHAPLLDTISQLRRKLALGDWGMVSMIQHVLITALPDRNSRVTYTWFLLNKLGYNAKLGLDGNAVILLMPSHSTLYGMQYTNIDGTHYYMLPAPSSSRIFTYSGEGSYLPDARAFELSLTPLIAKSQKTATVAFDYIYQDRLLPLEISFDVGVTEFLMDHPQLALAQYFSPHPGQPAAGSLKAQLQPLIQQLPHREAVRFLLQLSQYLFEYKTDHDQFQREKYLLIEESLHYGANDCEDRSIFLAWLVHALLGSDVIVLDYPGHVALAVKTQIRPGDDIIEYNNQKYVIVDPTYLGADVGMSMPSYRNTQPTVIAVDYAS